jgi:predicted RND superfamily exporter protein
VVRSRARRFLWLVFCGLIAGAAVLGISRLRVDNAPERFFVRGDESLARQARLEALFSRTREVRLLVLGDDLFSPSGLTALAAIEDLSSRHPAVIRTGGLWSRHRWLEPAWPPADIEAFTLRVADDPLDRAAGWIGRSGRAASVLVELAPTAGPEELTEIETAVRQALPSGFRLQVAGLPVFERAMNHSLRRLVVVHLPLLVAATTLLLWLEFRSSTTVLVPLLLVAAVEVTALAVLGYGGASIDMVSSVFVPLLFVLSLATAVHLLTGVRHELGAGLSPADAVVATLARKQRAVVWTVLTTGAAFGTFAVNPVSSIRSLGLWLAAGLAWLLILALGLYPGLMTAVATIAPSPKLGFLEGLARRRAPQLARWLLKRRRRVLLAFALLGAIAGAGLLQVRTGSGLASYFSPMHPTRRALQIFESEGLAAGAAHVMIRFPSDAEIGDGLRSPDGFERLADLSAELRTLPEVRGALGAGDLFSAALHDVVVEGEPSSGVRWLVLGMMQSDPEIATRLDSLLANEGRAARIILTLPLLAPKALDAALASVWQVADRAFPEATVEIAGELPLLVATQKHLATTLGVSLSVTLAVIVLSLMAVTRSARLTLLALTPNLWAVLVVFGVMGWLDVGLDSTTVMIAAIVAGLAVDDTFHVLAELNAAGGDSEARRWTDVLSRTAPALVLTSVVLSAGFAVLTLSEFAPIARLGGLATVGIIAALGADLLLLPALLAYPRPVRGALAGGTLRTPRAGARRAQQKH